MLKLVELEVRESGTGHHPGAGAGFGAERPHAAHAAQAVSADRRADGIEALAELLAQLLAPQRGGMAAVLLGR